MNSLLPLSTRSASIAIGLALSSVVVGLQLPADAVTFSFSSGSLAGSAKFTLDGDKLTVVLTNTSTADTLVPTDVLTAVFFNLSDNRTLTKQSALLANGSQVFYDPDGQPAGGNVGGEWAYKNGINVNGASQGISSTGAEDIFGANDLFGGPDLESPESPNGLEYGLLSAGDNTNTGNGGITGSGGLIKNSVVFTFLGASGLAEDDISNVSFLYGTDPNNNPPVDGKKEVPEPSTNAAFGLLALGGLGLIAKRNKKVE